MIAASRRGLAYEATKRMTLGQIVDYCIEYDNQETKEEPKYRKATQAEIDAFLR